MGSPGRRRGRRTRSDEPGGRVDITRGVGGWPVFRHVSFSPQGTWERWRALAEAKRDLSAGEELRRAGWSLRSAWPAMALFLVCLLAYWVGPVAFLLLIVVALVGLVRR